jgi:hypothetical protein
LGTRNPPRNLMGSTLFDRAAQWKSVAPAIRRARDARRRVLWRRATGPERQSKGRQAPLSRSTRRDPDRPIEALEATHADRDRTRCPPSRLGGVGAAVAGAQGRSVAVGLPRAAATARRPATERRAAVPKRGQCPSNWTQSGNYCIERRRR